jgi:hypothetical protein
VIEEGSEVLDGRKMVLYLSYPLSRGFYDV